ncbi:DUF2254 domain-containing protein [Cellulomonas sp. JZ18]|uniref:DUF2254 domain-containing protein n=1 Tax=Cellulomonas sp. JZ18 TaxID=2654191 RepID=UPI0012D40692|nr:DUF2254 domain-containing protein [Cellulomonas sp. JZ18]QGQ20595.1 DUF2254 domain-containing protein [Cellulomonas sp. JZ18]
MTAVVVGVALSHVRPPADSGLVRVLWPGDVAAATAAVQTVATATMATLTTAFSITVVALQLASQQFSPRLLRDFLRDRTIKTVLAVLVGTIALSLTVVRTLHEDEPVPVVALALVLVLAAASVTAVVAFVHHITGMLRIDSMMAKVHDESQRAIAMFLPERGDGPAQVPERLGPDVPGTVVDAPRGGFVQRVDVEPLVQRARAADVVVRVEARPGDLVVSGTPLLTLWTGDGRDAARVPDDVVAGLLAAVALGRERTVEQDAAFGFRQLEGIAVKALSPSINDPVTAAHAVGHMSELLVSLTGRRLGGTMHTDDDGVGRAVVMDRDLRYYLDLACGQVRRYGRREPTVLVALLRLCRDVGVHADPDAHAPELRRQVDLVLREMADDLLDDDRAAVRDLAERVRLVLDGRVAEAYADRSGETRSI